jgi:hypothetical protein
VRVSPPTLLREEYQYRKWPNCLPTNCKNFLKLRGRKIMINPARLSSDLPFQPVIDSEPLDSRNLPSPHHPYLTYHKEHRDTNTRSSDLVSHKHTQPIYNPAHSGRTTSRNEWLAMKRAVERASLLYMVDCTTGERWAIHG